MRPLLFAIVCCALLLFPIHLAGQQGHTPFVTKEVQDLMQPLRTERNRAVAQLTELVKTSPVGPVLPSSPKGDALIALGELNAVQAVPLILREISYTEADMRPGGFTPLRPAQRALVAFGVPAARYIVAHADDGPRPTDDALMRMAVVLHGIFGDPQTAASYVEHVPLRPGQSIGPVRAELLELVKLDDSSLYAAADARARARTPPASQPATRPSRAR